MTSTKDKSLIFCGEMVRAIGDGSKTQTRRIIVPQPERESWHDGWRWHSHRAMLGNAIYGHADAYVLKPLLIQYAPFQPGDVVRVRETAKLRGHGVQGPGGVRWIELLYRADNDVVERDTCGGYPGHLGPYRALAWTPSIHMPRWASRYFLEILSVRAERVQEITIEDCVAEGIDLEGEDAEAFAAAEKANSAGLSCGCRYPEIYPFLRLWDSLHEKPKRKRRNPYTGQKEDCYVSYPWEAIRERVTLRGLPHYIVGNPWVDVYGFKTVAAPTHSGQETP